MLEAFLTRFNRLRFKTLVRLLDTSWAHALIPQSRWSDHRLFDWADNQCADGSC